MATEWLVPAIAALVSGTFAATVWGKYAATKRLHHLAWGVGLTLYAAASLAEAYASHFGWTLPLYRLYFPLTSLLVGFLGLGTLYLLRQPRIGHAFATYVLATALLVTLGQFTIHLTPAHLDGATVDVGAHLIPKSTAPRIASILLNVLGGLALILGALWSAWQTRNLGILLIGLGALLPFVGGSLSTLNAPNARVLTQLAGICIMYAGFLRVRHPAPRSRGTEAPS